MSFINHQSNYLAVGPLLAMLCTVPPGFLRASRACIIFLSRLALARYLSMHGETSAESDCLLTRRRMLSLDLPTV